MFAGSAQDASYLRRLFPAIPDDRLSGTRSALAQGAGLLRRLCRRWSCRTPVRDFVHEFLAGTVRPLGRQVIRRHMLAHLKGARYSCSHAAGGCAMAVAEMVTVSRVMPDDLYAHSLPH